MTTRDSLEPYGFTVNHQDGGGKKIYYLCLCDALLFGTARACQETAFSRVKDNILT
jgi:hypothetical protein